LLFLLILPLAVLATGAEIYVSPTGNDAAPGTKAQPVATLERARDLARQAKQGGDAKAPVRVILAGTDMDFRGNPFGAMNDLLAIAETVTKLHAICVRCGSLATRNQRLINGEPAPAEGPTIQVGGLESYEARCRKCHEVPAVNRDQIALIP
jgi:hypothetical protein